MLSKPSIKRRNTKRIIARNKNFLPVLISFAVFFSMQALIFQIVFYRFKNIFSDFSCKRRRVVYLVYKGHILFVLQHIAEVNKILYAAGLFLQQRINIIIAVEIV